MRYTIMFGALALACAIAACGGDDPPPDNTPKKPPVNWDDQADRDWLYDMQFKTHMRHLWIDCNRIVSAGRGELQPTWVEIESAAADIQQRATLMAGFWAEIDARAAETIACAEDDDRIGASREFQALNAACDGCHMATWSPAYLHVTEGNIARWRNNQISETGVSETDPEPPPAIPNREIMKTLWYHVQMADLRLQKWYVEDLKQELGKVRPEAAKRAERWKAVADEAGKIAETAKKRKRDGMKAAYEKMTLTCLQCHTETAGPIREIMIPMQWDGS